MLRRDDLRRFAARTGSAGMLATLLAASVADAALPTGGMLLPRPKGPSRNDLPSSTSFSAYRVPSAIAYGMGGASDTASGDSAFAVASTRSPAKRTATVNLQSSERQPLIQPRTLASNDAENAFSRLEPATDQPLELSPFDASGEVSPATFADLRTVEAADHASVEPAGKFAGLKGICRVTLREERRVVTPRPELFSMHGGRRFEFATPDAKAAFDANPQMYAPVLGGRDVVLTASGADEAIGSLKHAGFFRERLYLFQSDESCRAFRENPRRFAVRDQDVVGH